MRIRLILLLLCCAVLTGCAADPLEDLSSPAASALPSPQVANRPVEVDEAVLWFRMGTEGLLAPEVRALSHAKGGNLAQPILMELLAGPSAAAAELQPLFPQGTQLVSLTQEDGMVYVTLSSQVLSAYPDEPEDWQSDPYWAVEVPLRRKLAMQAIAATLTENCGAQSVMVLVAQDGLGEGALRLQNSYFCDGRQGAATPITRDESLLLTPQRTAEVILQCCQESDWNRLYRYVARADRPAQEDFLLAMDQLPRLTQYTVAGGSLSGKQAVFTVSGTYLDGGTEVSFTGRILRLTKERGLWRTTYAQLAEGGLLP